MIMKFAADEEFYPIRRRGEKRRLDPNRAAIEWLETDAEREMHAVTVYMVDDTGARYSPEEAAVLRRDMLKVTRTYGANSGSHHSRPIFECFSINKVKRATCSSSSCGNCDNFAYSFRGCELHGVEDAQPKPNPHRDTLREIQGAINRIGEHDSEYRAALYASYAVSGGPAVNVSWRVSPS